MGLGPRVSIDRADVAFDRAHMSLSLAITVRLTSGTHWLGLT